MGKEIKSEFIPIKPISINACYQGRRYRTNAFKKWQELVWHYLPKKEVLKRDGHLGIIIYLYLKSLWKSDIDNFCKPIIDCMVKKRYLLDDRYITYLEVHKFKSEEEGFKFSIIRL